MRQTPLLPEQGVPQGVGPHPGAPPEGDHEEAGHKVAEQKVEQQEEAQSGKKRDEISGINSSDFCCCPFSL